MSASNKVEPITTVDLYNLLQDSSISKLLVDVRSPEQYITSCIRNFINVAFTKRDVEDELRGSIDDLNVFSEVKKYAWDENKCSIKDSKDWNYRGTLFRQLVLVDDEDGQSWMMKKVIKLLLSEDKIRPENIRYLTPGFTQFAVEYPFLISSQINSAKAMDGLLPTEIFPKFCYLGSYENASNLKQLRHLGITHILNMADELENKFANKTTDSSSQDPSIPSFTYLKCGVDDTSSDNIGKFFQKAIDFIDDAKKDPTSRVLVHCAMGISRSSAVAIAWLMKEKLMNFEQARDYVKSQRHTIKPNEGFVRQLKQFEIYLGAANNANTS